MKIGLFVLILASFSLAQDTPPIPTAQGIHIKTGNEWKSLDKAPIPQLGSKGKLGAAFSYGASSVKAVCKLQGQVSSNTVIALHPVFYAVDLQAIYSVRDFVIVRMEQKKDHREQQYASARFGSAKMVYKPEDITEVKVEKVSDTVFTIEPVKDMTPGEYILALAPGCSGYDFSIPQPKKESQ